MIGFSMDERRMSLFHGGRVCYNLLRMNRHLSHEIACQQALLPDSSVYSVQWIKLPANLAKGISPRFLVERYLEYIRRFTLTIVRPVKNDGAVEFRLLDSRVSLLSFNGPTTERDGNGERLTLCICGGLLVQPERRNRGALSFTVIQESGEAQLILELTDYFPAILGGLQPSRLRKRLYRLTQAYIHKAATVRFLARFCREAAGRRLCIKVVRARVRDGAEI